MPSRFPSAESLQVAGINPSIQPINIPTNPIPGALQNLGTAVQGYGERQDSESQTAGGVDKSAAFQAQADFIKFQSDWDTYSDEVVRQAPVGAAGIRTKLGETYKDLAGTFVQKLDPKLQPEYTVRLLQKQVQERARAIKFEQDEATRATNAKLEDGLKTLGNNVAGAKDLPDLRRRADENIKAGDEYIRNLPGATPIEIERRQRAWHASMPKVEAETLNTLDPYAAQQMYRDHGVPSGAEQATVRYYMDRGLTKVQAAAVAASFGAESSHNPNSVNPRDGSDGSNSVGLGQWNGERAVLLKRFAAMNGALPNDPNIQHAFVLWEMDNGVANGDPKTALAGQMLRQAQTPEEAAKAMTFYERGRGWSPDNPTGIINWQGRLAGTQRLAGSHIGGPPAVGPEAPLFSGDANTFLKGRLAPGKGPDSIDGLQPAMQDRLAALFHAAPPEIADKLGVFSGHRTIERQKELWDAALKKYGSAAEARKWVAPPGQSQHGEGNAADLAYGGISLQNAPANVVSWLHDNAGKYGLKFPLANENWHIELAETRGGGALVPGGGTNATPAALDAHGNPQSQNAPHPLIDGLSPMDRLAYAADADARVQLAEAQVQKQDQERYDTWKNDFQTGIIDGKVGLTDVQQARDAGILTDAGDIASFMNAIDQRDKEMLKTQAAIGYVSTQQTGGNAYSKPQLDLVNKGYQGLGGATGLIEGDPAAAQRTQTVINNTKVIPPDAIAAFRNGLDSNDPQTVARTLGLTSSILASNPKAFEAYDGGPSIRSNTEVYDKLTRDMGMSADKAAKYILEENSPQFRSAQENAKKRGGADDKATLEYQLKNLKVDDIPSAMNLHQDDLAKMVGYDEATKNTMLGEYKTLFEHYYLTGNGNPEIAKTKAVSDLKHIWGVTHVGIESTKRLVTGEVVRDQKPAWVKYPIENFIPAIDGNKDYIYKEVVASAIEALKLNDDKVSASSVQPGVALPLTGMRGTLFAGAEDILDAYLVATPRTKADIDAGQGPPRYNLYYQHYDKYGQPKWDALPSGLTFGVTNDRLNQIQVETDARHATEFENERIRRETLQKKLLDQAGGRADRGYVPPLINQPPSGGPVSGGGGRTNVPQPTGVSNFISGLPSISIPRTQPAPPPSPPPVTTRESYIGGRPAFGSRAEPPPPTSDYHKGPSVPPGPTGMPERPPSPQPRKGRRRAPKPPPGGRTGGMF